MTVCSQIIEKIEGTSLLTVEREMRMSVRFVNRSYLHSSNVPKSVSCAASAGMVPVRNVFPSIMTSKMQ